MAALILKARFYGQNEDEHYDVSTGKPEEEDENFWKLFLILQDYLQPCSSISLNDAVDRALNLYDDAVPHAVGLYDNGSNGNWLYRSNLLAIDLSKQIPFGHPAHVKLSHYLIAIGKSEKLATRIQWKAYKSEDVTRMYNQKLKENLADEYLNADSYEQDEDVMEYVNGQAFLAIFHSTGGHCYRHSVVHNPMYDAFETDHSKTSQEVYEALVMGAAQHIKYTIREAWELVEKPDEAGQTPSHPRCQNLVFRFWSRSKQGKCRKERDREKFPFTMEQWHNFRDGFRNVADAERYSKLCRQIAEEAADSMALQEKAWLEQQRPCPTD